jgi:L-lactate utilization protein LutB
VTFTLPEPGTANSDFAQPATAERLEHTAEALRQRGFQVTIAESGEQARQLVLDALPEGAEVHTGLSETLQQIGLTDVLENSGRYDP